jgi:hypothetical protein
VIFLASLGTVYLLDSDRQLTLIDWIVPSVLGIAMVLFFPRRFEANLRKRLAAQLEAEKTTDRAGKHTANILPTMIVQTSRGGEIRAPWTTIGQIIITADHVCIIVDEVRGIVIPRQGFADATQYEQAKALVAQHQPKGR